MKKVPETIPEDERIWFALAAYNLGYGHMLDARKLTKSQNGNPDSWVDVKMRLPMLSQKRYYPSTTYGYARGHEAYNYVENIRRYQDSLVGYLQEKEKKPPNMPLLKLNWAKLIPLSAPAGQSIISRALGYNRLLAALISRAMC